MHNENFGTLSANGSLTLNARGMNHANISVRGTYSGTVNFEATTDGVNWVAIKDTFGGASATSTTSTGEFQFAIGAFVEIRARMSSYASGSAVIALAAIPA